MKGNIKRLFSALLCLFLIMPCLTVLAEEDTTESETETQEQTGETTGTSNTANDEITTIRQNNAVPTNIKIVGTSNRTFYAGYTYIDGLQVAYEPEDADDETIWTSSSRNIIHTESHTSSVTCYPGKPGQATVTAVSKKDPTLSKKFKITVVEKDPPTGTFSVNLIIYPVIADKVDKEHPLAENPKEFVLDLGKEYAFEVVFDSKECVPSDRSFTDAINQTKILSKQRGIFTNNREGTIVVSADKPGIGTFKLANEYTCKITVVNPDAGWKENPDGWSYVRQDNTRPNKAFEVIDGKTYYFDDKGIMTTGWKEINGKYYFFLSSGIMKTSAWEDNYYLKENGVMASQEWVENHKYFVDKDGKWIKDYGKPHWVNDSSGWSYDSDGYGHYLADRWETINGATYYFLPSGYAATGWQKIKGDWYFFKNSGVMKTDAWEGNCYLTYSGRMATNRWIGHYYVGNDGETIDYPYVASKRSEVFHRWDCREADKIKESNLISFSSYEEASSDRRPCKVCGQ